MMQLFKIRPRLRVIVLILSLILCTPLMAMGGYTGSQIGRGQIQKIDYQHHTITVNGETFAVSPTARYKGVGGFSVLSVGMPIQYLLGNTTSSNFGPPDGTPPKDSGNQAPSSPSNTIVSITWLPGGIK